MELFENLNENEKELLLSAPVYISLLTAAHDGAVDEEEKKAALREAHLKSFNPDPLVSSYYKAVEASFYEKIDELYNTLPADAAEREIKLRDKIHQVQELLTVTGTEESKKLLLSLESYSWHVSQSHRNVGDDFVIPVRIKGLTA